MGQTTFTALTTHAGTCLSLAYSPWTGVAAVCAEDGTVRCTAARTPAAPTAATEPDEDVAVWDTLRTMREKRARSWLALRACAAGPAQPVDAAWTLTQAAFSVVFTGVDPLPHGGLIKVRYGTVPYAERGKDTWAGGVGRG